MTNKKITSVGIIMDGNRRWAKERGLSSINGHRAGYEKLKEVVVWAKESDIRHMIVYGFSTENWNRSEEEVGYLMELFRTLLKEESEKIKKEGGRLRIVGQRDRFPKDIQEEMARAEEDTKEGEYTLWLALSYGGRAEILDTVNQLIKAGELVSEEDFGRALWTAGMPDPDLIIRTSGEQRLSGFLPWQGVYSELFFVDSYWPAFSKEEFQQVLKEFSERERRHGK